MAAIALIDQFKQTLVEAATLGEKIATQEAQVTAEEAQVLATLITAIKPVMRYIDRPVRQSGSVAGNQFADWRYAMMPQQGVVLAGGLEKDTTSGDQNRGDFTGHDLVLARDGTLFARTFAGSWSQWQGESEWWSAVPATADEGEGYTEYPASGGATVAVTPEKAVTLYDLKDLIDGLIGALTRASEQAASKQRTLAGRLERLNAVKAALV